MTNAKKPAPVAKKEKKAIVKKEQKPKTPKASKRNKKADDGALKDDRLELLFLIVNRNKAEYYADLLQSFDVNMELISLAHGTASASLMALLRLNDSDKTMIIGAIQAKRIKDALATLEQKFKTIRNGQGIAYTVPMTSVIGTLIFGFLSNNRKFENNSDKKETK